ncbi:glucokinase [Colletotrichum truncatum]|uniref:Glucokinase n=1 Tax=Colletotrichum truncatum TaxID=5467 RepID=A0ACC3ZGW9_COLTU|nr:glucokinase [Colletotrichum truncatum]KAF6790499.1 glucokinase [Colletotrichum truncatum]
MATLDDGKRNPSSMLSQARTIAKEFEFLDNDVCRATTHFLKQLNEGLQKDGTSMCQIPSYVTKLPNGSEKGVCLAIDLGGTNLRVCSVDLHGDSTYSLTQSKVTIPRHLMVAKTYKDLFNFIAVQTKTFMEKHHKPDLDKWAALLKEGAITEEIRLKHTKSLGFTFSFTFDQHALNKGTLLYWTKSFDIPDAVGRDPCAMLQEALDEQNLPLSVTALANDTVGTLAARAYTSPGRSTTVVGAIFGTGTNGAYMERISRITKLHSLQGASTYEPGALMALNTEWGGFDNKLEVLPTTKFDRDLDRDSVNPDDQHFEKRISGMYLGELLRRVVLHMMDSKHDTFDMRVSAKSKLHEPESIDSSLLSSVLQDSSESLAVARDRISRAFGATGVSVSDAQAIQILSEAIGRRAARLSSVAIAGVAIQSGRLASTDIAKPLAAPWGLGFNVLTLFLCSMRGLWNTLTGWLHVKIRIKIPSKGISGAFPNLAIHGASPVNGSEGDIDIGVDGSLIEHFPNFENNIREALRKIPQIGVAGENRIKIGMATDGSGVGAALIAWAARA